MRWTPFRYQPHVSQCLFALLLLTGASLLPGCKSEKTPNVQALPKVSVSQPVVESVTDQFEFTGNTAAYQSAQLVARVEGYLSAYHFKDGARVKKGDLLFTIQPDQYKSQLQQAEAQVQAQQAALWHAKTEFARYSDLFKKNAAAQVDVDNWHFQRDSAQAALLAAEAQLDVARLNLSYTEVRAPFDGRMGRHLVDAGNLVGAMGQQTSLAQIDQIDPLYVYFTINEQDLLRVLGQQRDLPQSPLLDRHIPVFFALANEDDFKHEGVLDFASVNVSSTTGTLQLRGIFANPGLNILPGLFVRVRVPVSEQRNALLVPGDAVSFDQQGSYVLVVDGKSTVERRSVKTGMQVGATLVIESGLKPDDWIVVGGLFQAIPGRKVEAVRVSEPSSKVAVDPMVN